MSVKSRDTIRRVDNLSHFQRKNTAFSVERIFFYVFFLIFLGGSEKYNYVCIVHYIFAG